MVTRIYTASNGLAYAEELEMERTAAGAYKMLSVTGAQFSARPRRPAGTGTPGRSGSTSSP